MVGQAGAGVPVTAADGDGDGLCVDGRLDPRAVASRLAEATGEYTMAGGTWGEVFDVPLTAHFLGGAAIGGDPSTGVVDQWHRVFGHPGISITDGSTISANLGVNPSLTITAQAERAMALWPRKGSRDPRPAPPTLDP